jgi:Ser/Thr protein kinase RdoA (MazF antagonist)
VGAESGRGDERLSAVGAAFAIEGSYQGGERHGSGHIHRTFLVRYAAPGGPVCFLHQWLNTQVFRDPEALMENLVRVTRHLREKLRERGLPDPERRCLQLVAARDGRSFHIDAEGGVWRTFRFVEGTRGFDAIESPAQAFEAARAFGAFAEMLADLPPPPLHATIPHFHDLGQRVEDFEAALRSDACGRAVAAGVEIEALRRRVADLERELAALEVAALPRRVVHHDCKLNNLLFDRESGEALCVIDLDTVMEGNLLSDFGELVRTGTCRAPEDERDLARVHFDLTLFEALARGYLAGIGNLLTQHERRALPVAGRLFSLMNAMRFLTDHLTGDVYFRIRREGHNLDRARAQLRLAEQMLERADQAREIVERAATG